MKGIQMATTLGIDIGSYSIKVILLDTNYNKVMLRDYQEEIIPESTQGEEYELRRKILHSMIKKYKNYEYLSITALPGNMVSYRLLDFFNAKKRDLERLNLSELEAACQFSIENYMSDFQIISHSKIKSQLLSLLCQKHLVIDFIHFLEDSGIKPKILDLDAISYTNLIPLIFEEKDKKKVQEKAPNNVMIVDLGHKKTILSVLSETGLKNIQVVNFAGQYITDGLRRTFELSQEEATSLKHYVGRIDLDSDKVETVEKSHDKDELIAKRMTYLSLELVDEIKRLIQTQKFKENIKISKIYLTGGTSKIKNIDKLFEIKTKIPTEYLNFSKEKLKTEHNLEFNSSAFQSLAIAMRATYHKLNSTINFRKGDLVLESNYSSLTKKTYAIIAFFLILTGTLELTHYIRKNTYSSKVEKLEQNFKKDVNSISGKMPVTYRKLLRQKESDGFEEYKQNALKVISSHLKREEHVLKELKFSSKSVPLSVIQEISKIIPKNMYFEVSQFKISNNQLLIDAETDKQENISKTINSLSKSSLFSNVEKRSQTYKPGTDNKIIRFAFTGMINGDKIDE